MTTLTRPVPTLYVSRPPDASAEITVRDEAQAVLAPARVDTVRVRFGPDARTPEAVRRLVDRIEEAVAALRRDRASLRILLDVHVVVVPDEASAERRRALFATNDAMASLGWAASATWVVAPEWRVAADATALAARTGVDGVVLLPIGPAHAQLAAWRRGR